MDIQLSLQWLNNDYKSFDMNIDNFTPSPAYLPIYLLAHPPTHTWPTYLPTYLPTHPSTYLLTHSSTYLLIYLPLISYLL
jgi:hypothetical protein